MNINKDAEWHRVIANITSWLRDPTWRDVDKPEPPTVESTLSALRFITECWQTDKEIPTRIIPNGDGGLSMSYNTEPDCLERYKFRETPYMHETYEFHRDGGMEKDCGVELKPETA